MGKKSKAPAAPDYAGAAKAQGAANKDVAAYTTAMDRPNQYSPYGTSAWEWGGEATKARYQGDYDQLQSYKTTLADYNSQLQAAQAALAANPRDKNAKKQISNINKQIKSTTKAQSKLQATYDKNMAAARDKPLPGDLIQRTSLSPEEQKIFEAEQRNRLGMENLASGAMSRAGSILNQNFNPSLTAFRQAQGLRGSNVGLPQFAGDNVGLAQYARANVGLPEYLQSRVGMGNYNADLAGLPQWQQDQLRAQGYQGMGAAPTMGADQVGLAGNTLSDVQDLAESNDAFSAEAQQVRDATYQQLTRFADERFGRQEAQERNRLAQMGLQEGSAAYKNAMSEFRRSMDESYSGAQLEAILAGGNEQSRLRRDQLSTRESNLGLRQGQFNQNMLRDQQDMAERMQNYQAGANAWSQNQSDRQYQFQAGMAQDQQDLAERNAAYAAGANTYGLGQSERQFDFNADMQRYQADMADRQNMFNAGTQRYGMDQSERMNQFNTSMARDQQDLQERLAGFNTGAQRYQMDLGERQAAATSELNLANLAAAQRQQQFNEQAYQRSLPINEISALLNGGGVNMPQFAQFAGATPFAAPDIMGATQAQYQAQLGQYNAAQQQKGGLLGAGAGLLGGIMGK